MAWATRPPAICTFFSAQALAHPSMVMQTWLCTALTASGLVELRLTGWSQDQELLLDATAYADSVKRRAEEE